MPGGHAVQHLDGDHAVSAGGEREQDAAHRQDGIGKQEDGLAADTARGRPPDRPGDAHHHQLGHDDARRQRDGGLARMLLGQDLPGHRQHRRIGEMEQQDSAEKDQQVAPAQQRAEGRRLAVAASILAAAGAGVVDLAGDDPGDDAGTGHRKGADEIEQPVDPDILAQPAGQAGSDEVAGVVEAFVAADPRGQQPPARRGPARARPGRAGSPPRPPPACACAAMHRARSPGSSTIGQAARCPPAGPATATSSALGPRAVHQQAGRHLADRRGRRCRRCHGHPDRHPRRQCCAAVPGTPTGRAPRRPARRPSGGSRRPVPAGTAARRRRPACCRVRLRSPSDTNPEFV